jgi:hypothetical protein
MANKKPKTGKGKPSKGPPKKSSPSQVGFAVVVVPASCILPNRNRTYQLSSL